MPTAKPNYLASYRQARKRLKSAMDADQKVSDTDFEHRVQSYEKIMQAATDALTALVRAKVAGKL